jgi:hypothetical protein
MPDRTHCDHETVIVKTREAHRTTMVLDVGVYEYDDDELDEAIVVSIECEDCGTDLTDKLKPEMERRFWPPID